MNQQEKIKQLEDILGYKLPDNLSVGGSLYLRNTQITSSENVIITPQIGSRKDYTVFFKIEFIVAVLLALFMNLKKKSIIFIQRGRNMERLIESGLQYLKRLSIMLLHNTTLFGSQKELSKLNFLVSSCLDNLDTWIMRVKRGLVFDDEYELPSKLYDVCFLKIWDNRINLKNHGLKLRMKEEDEILISLTKENSNSTFIIKKQK